MSNTYPIVKGSKNILNIIQSIVRPEFEEPKVPIKPELIINQPIKPQKSDFEKGGSFLTPILFGGIGAILMYYVISNSKNANGTAFLLFLFFIFMVIFSIYYIIKEGGENTKKYDEQLKVYNYEIANFSTFSKIKETEFNNALLKYNENLIIYQIDLENYKSHLIEIEKSEYITQYKREQLWKIFSKNISPQESNKLVSKGVTEDYFVSLLQSKLKIKVLQNLMLKFENSENGFHPDIILYDEKSGLLIDIEIDEPYVGTTGSPIHYEDGNDKKRDDFFLKNGWIVLRFAEEQIVKNTTDCINLVELLLDLFNNFNVEKFQTFEKFPEIHINKKDFFVNQWTKDQAHKKAFARYRNSYLSISFVEKLETENL